MPTARLHTFPSPAFVLGVLTVVAFARPGAQAVAEEPYLSIRTGLRCSQCHVNRTGGGGRNEFGNIYAQAFLPMVRKFDFLSRGLNDFLSVGADFRVLASGTPARGTPRTALEVTEANIQIEARVVRDVLAVYVDQTVAPGTAVAREAFLLLEALPLDGYVKVGQFLLPYGLRLADDTEFIRERTGFNLDTPDQGVEAGIEPGPISAFLALTNGTRGAAEDDSDKQLTGTVALVLPRFRVGVSGSRNEAGDTRRDVVGGFAGLALGRFAFLGELDYILDDLEAGREVDQLAAYLEGDFLPARGVNVKVTYGFLDPNRDIGENAKTRMRLGLELFPIQFLQVSAFYTLLQDIPQATTDLDRLGLELHLHF